MSNVEVPVKYFKGPAQRIGWLFLLATVAGVLSVVVMASTLGDEDLLAAVQANQDSLLIGQMLIFVNLGCDGRHVGAALADTQAS